MFVSLILFHLLELHQTVDATSLRLSAEPGNKHMQFGHKLNKERFWKV